MNTGKDEFLELEEARGLIREITNNTKSIDFMDLLIKKQIVVPILNKKQVYIYKKEFELCKRLYDLNCQIEYDEVLRHSGYDNFLQDRIKIGCGTFIIFPLKEKNITVPAFAKNIIYNYKDMGDCVCKLYRVEIYNIIISTTNRNVKFYVNEVLERKRKLGNIKKTNFANSSSYMGSKKKISGFLVDSIIPYMDKSRYFLDIMCGSGAVSNAMAQFNEVFASDAQDFCRLLAKVQGGGYRKEKAEKILETIYIHYLNNLRKLKKKFSYEMEQEDRIFHMNTDNIENVLFAYQRFIYGFNLYSSSYPVNKSVQECIDRRKKNHKQEPYCLFTYYYSNIYFGLSQSIQLDSLRYAIDQIEEIEDREWAIGVLVVVTSFVATTYAGHFAQPKKINKETIEKIIKQRQKSVWLEFSKRFLCIAEESHNYPFCVHTVSGPWETALNEIKGLKTNWLIYLDAPYKREEYSRYYHVLETIVKYDYPSSEKKGRLRSKEKGERFSSNFFSKSNEKIENEFVKIIGSILSLNAICVWSYSDNGNASIKNVISMILSKYSCDIFLYCIPYRHQSQGKNLYKPRTSKDVIEYCIIFRGKDF